MTLRERIDNNMRVMAQQSAGQLILSFALVAVILGAMTAFNLISVAGLIGGLAGWSIVQIIARARYRA
jgi:hypothetical protein